MRRPSAQGPNPTDSGRGRDHDSLPGRESLTSTANPTEARQAGEQEPTAHAAQDFSRISEGDSHFCFRRIPYRHAAATRDGPNDLSGAQATQPSLLLDALACDSRVPESAAGGPENGVRVGGPTDVESGRDRGVSRGECAEGRLVLLDSRDLAVVWGLAG